MSAFAKTANKGINVLIVEDSPTQAEHLTYLLEEEGYAVTAATDGRLALAAASARKPTIIISDIMMPEMDGYALCKAIKSDDRLKDIPVILVTDLNSPQDVVMGLQCCADNFITKPYDPQFLLARITQSLKNRQLRESRSRRTGAEIDLAGRRYVITAERHQILDLLIPTYEEAVRLNQKLREHEKELAWQVQERTADNAALAEEVAERKRAEEALRIKTEQLGTVTDAMTAFLVSGDFRQASAQLLHGALRQTEGEYGFVGVMVEGPVLRILAHEGLVWSTTVNREFYDQTLSRYRELGYLEFTDFDNLFGRVITDGKPVLANDPSTDPRAGGLPPGHPPLRHFLGVPIRKGAEVVGMIGVANRPGGYTGQEQAKIEILSRAASVLYDSYRRRERELALEVERTRLQEERDRFFTLSLDLLCIAGFDGYFKRLNPAWSHTLGYRTDELLAKPYLEFVHPDDREATAAKTAQLMAGGDTLTFENRYGCKDGAYKWLLWSSTPDHQHRLIYATARDMTDRKRAEEEIKTRTEQVEAANKELEAFSYSVSHDLRAPLRHIDGFADLLLKHVHPTLDEKGRRYLKTISESAKQMGRLIDNLLSFARMGRADMQRTSVPLTRLVEETLRELTPDTQGRAIAWRIAPLPTVQGDPAMLKQVFLNLIGNAVKYTRPRAQAVIEVGTLGTAEAPKRPEQPDASPPPPTARHRADILPPPSRRDSEEEAGARGDEVVIYVRDNGVGFDMQYAHKLFGVFQRLHSAGEFEGTGIGLASVRRIIQRHGGRVWAEGTVDKDATFYFTLRGDQAHG